MALKRRDFLKASAACAAAAAGNFSCVEFASAAPIDAPEVDRVSVRVLVDGAYNLFLRPGDVKGVKIEPPPRVQDYRRSLHSQWACRCSWSRSAQASSAPSCSTSATRRTSCSTTWSWSAPIRRRSRR